MAITNGYATLANFRSLISAKTGDTSKDAFYEDCIERASRYIDSKTNRRWYATTLTNHLVDSYAVSSAGISMNKNRLYFPCGNISISTIYEDGGLLVDQTDFWLNDDYIEKSEDWTTERRNSSTGAGVKITGSFGYSNGAPPDDVQQICLQISKIFAEADTKTIMTEDGVEAMFVNKSIPAYVKDWMILNKRVVTKRREVSIRYLER